MIEANSAFSVFAGALSKIGWFIVVPLILVAFLVPMIYEFENESTKTKISYFMKVLIIVFLFLQVPKVLVGWVS